MIGSAITPTTAGDGGKILYVNQYYQWKTFNDVTTISYYLGSRLIAIKQGETLSYVMQDHRNQYFQ